MIFIQLSEQLQLLRSLLKKLDNEQYVQKISFLGNASIGAHTRHIIELLKCVTDGYELGAVDYINRIRDLSLESDHVLAIHEIEQLLLIVNKPDKQMDLATENTELAFAKTVTTTYFREIVYNAEHAIHHLALIRVALRELKLDIVGDNFGMAYATIKYIASLDEVQN